AAPGSSGFRDEFRFVSDDVAALFRGHCIHCTEHDQHIVGPNNGGLADIGTPPEK
ncbi:unnamed protein product, partial [Prorocentrum cordatum]